MNSTKNYHNQNIEIEAVEGSTEEEESDDESQKKTSKVEPDIFVHETQYDVKFKNTCVIVCKVSPPRTKISWMKRKSPNARNIIINQTTEGKYSGLDSQVLSIFNVDDSDAAVYQCIAENSQGTARSNRITVTVTAGLRQIKGTVKEHKPSHDDLCTCKTEHKLISPNDLRIGLEVAFGRIKHNMFKTEQYLYKHHGIIININENNKTMEIADLTANGNRLIAVSNSTREPTITNSYIKYDPIDDSMFYYEYSQHSFPHVLTKERAKIMFNIFEKTKLKYQLYSFNCEHFATYCATGLAYSRQSGHSNTEATEVLDKELVLYNPKPTLDEHHSWDSSNWICQIM